MEDFSWILWIVIIVASMAGSIIKAQKKAAERERAAGGSASGSGTGVAGGLGSGSVVGSAGSGSGLPDGQVRRRKSFAEVIEELAERYGEQSGGVGGGGPVATSEDYYSLEDEHIGEEQYSFEGEIEAYERLAAERARRTTYTAATQGRATVGTAAPVASTSFAATSAAPAMAAMEDTQTTVQEILGDEFDLRRAVIEAEILTPKFGRY